MKTAGWLALGVTLLLAPPVHARKKLNVTMSDASKVAGKPVVLNGMGVREASFLKVDVYVAGLYLEKKSQDPMQILSSTTTKQLVLHFVREVDRDDLVSAFEEGFGKTSGKNAKAFAARVGQLNGWMTNMKVGERLILTEVPGRGIEVSVKGRIAGRLPGVDFARALWTIFLGPEPPNAGLKAGLLGKD